MHKSGHVDPVADRVLSLLSGRPEAGHIILGGYFALQHYLDYRDTHDVDACWKDRADAVAEDAIRRAMQQVAAEQGMERPLLYKRLQNLERMPACATSEANRAR